MGRSVILWNWTKLLIALAGATVVLRTARTTTDPNVVLGQLVPLRPELTRVLMKSSLPLVVDIYWLRAINAVGTARTEAEHLNLAEYGRVLTTLDPDFAHAYWLIGISLPFNRGRENWVHGDLSVDILERGGIRFPRDLRLQLLLGYSLMTFTTRFSDAARAFEAASQLPDAPQFCALLATRLYLKDSRYDTALSLAQSMRDAAETEEEKALFQDRVKELLDEDVLRKLDEAGAEFKKKYGNYPSHLKQLIKEGLVQEPIDAKFEQVRFDEHGRALLPDSKGRLKVFHDSGGGRDDDAPETWR